MSSTPQPPVPPGASDQSTFTEPRQVVHSAEQVALHLPVAGPTSRMLAYAADWLLLWTTVALLFLVAFLGTPLLGRVSKSLSELFGELSSHGVETVDLAVVFPFIMLFLLILVAEVCYFVIWEMTNRGRSPGKVLLRLRVVCDGGRPLTMSASLLRNLLRVVDFLPMNYVTGFVTMLISTEGKRLGDLAAGTVVIRLDRPGVATPLRLEDDASAAAFRFDRPQLARIGKAERALLRQTLRRVDSLAPDRAEEALQRAVEVLRTRIDYTEPVRGQDRQAFLRALLRVASRR